MDDRSFLSNFLRFQKGKIYSFVSSFVLFFRIFHLASTFLHSAIPIKNSCLFVPYQLNKCSFDFYLLTSIKITFCFFATTLFVCVVLIFLLFSSCCVQLKHGYRYRWSLLVSFRWVCDNVTWNWMASEMYKNILQLLT